MKNYLCIAFLSLIATDVLAKTSRCSIYNNSHDLKVVGYVERNYPLPYGADVHDEGGKLVGFVGHQSPNGEVTTLLTATKEFGGEIRRISNGRRYYLIFRSKNEPDANWLGWVEDGVITMCVDNGIHPYARSSECSDMEKAIGLALLFEKIEH